MRTCLLDFGVVGPGPRRTLNYIANRYWFDNQENSSPAAAAMYLRELEDFQIYLRQHTTIDVLQDLNLLGIQFALCEASKYIFYLEFASGPEYKPKSREQILEIEAPDSEHEARIKHCWSVVVWNVQKKLQKQSIVMPSCIVAFPYEKFGVARPFPLQEQEHTNAVSSDDSSA